MHKPPKIRFQPQRKSVINRGQACALAASQPQRAFDVAMTIPDGWYRCQAMSEVGRHAPEPLSSKAFAKAREAAADAHDTYQRCAVLGFAIGDALARGRRDLAGAMLADALTLVPTVEPVPSRAEALHLLWAHVARAGDRAMREAVITALVAHLHPDHSWRARRLYRIVVANLAWDRPDWAEKLIRAMPDGKTRTRIARWRAAGERRQPW